MARAVGEGDPTEYSGRIGTSSRRTCGRGGQGDDVVGKRFQQVEKEGGIRVEEGRAEICSEFGGKLGNE